MSIHALLGQNGVVLLYNLRGVMRGISPKTLCERSGVNPRRWAGHRKQ